MSEKPFQIPNSLLSQLNECSNGGYMLFTFNSLGQPVVHSNFDNPMTAMAIEYYINHHMKTLDIINTESSVDIFNDSFTVEFEDDPTPPEDIFEEDDEDEDIL